MADAGWLNAKGFQLTASQGGWLSRKLYSIWMTHFNSQPHKEADENAIPDSLPSSSFQLTASQGGWPEAERQMWEKQWFQLTASQGGWPYHHVQHWVFYHISTHSLTRRLTSPPLNASSRRLFQLTASQGGWQRSSDLKNHTQHISTHSLTRRLTSLSTVLICSNVISTHSLTRRLTSENLLFLHPSLYFNSQPHKEADHFLLFVLFSQGYFNSQPHKEADVVIIFILVDLVISTHSLTRRLTAISDKNIFIQNWFFYLLYILVLFFIQIIIF